MAEFEDFFDENLLRFFEEESSVEEEEERPEEEEKTVKDKDRSAEYKERTAEEERPPEEETPAVEVDAAIIEELLREEAISSELERLKSKNNNNNTKRSTTTWKNAFDKWRTKRNIRENLEDIPKENLDKTLQLFFAEVRKRNGEEYEPDSLRTMLAGLDRYLKEKGCKFSILRDREFNSCRKILNGKAIELHEKGCGKRKRRADAVSEEEEELLWSKGILGGNDPLFLNLTLFYCISQHFGTRGCQEYHQLRVEDIKFVRNPTDGTTEYIEWNEGPTKIRQGGLVKTYRRVTQRMFATGDKIVR